MNLQQRGFFNCYSRAINNVDAKAMVTACGTQIKDDWEYMRQCYTRYGPSIAKKWMKLTRTKRGAWILAVDPDIYQSQWSQFHLGGLKATFKQVAIKVDEDIAEAITRTLAQDRQFPNARLAPDICLETLQNEPLKFLSLFYNRAKHHPAEWLPLDYQQTRVAYESGRYELIFNPNCVDMNAETYPRLALVKWKEEFAHQGRMIGFPRGIMTMQGQCYRMKLVRGILEKIVDAIQAEPGSFDIDIPLPDFQLKRNSSGELPSTFLNRSYNAPPRLDITDLILTTESRMDFAWDHLMLLQTDPRYLKWYADQFTNSTVCLKQHDPRFIYGIATRDIQYDVGTYWMWKNILEEVKKVGSYEEGKSNGETVVEGLAALDALVVHEIDRLARHIFFTITQRPAFRHYFEWNNSILGQAQLIGIKPIYGGSLFKNHPLLWCLLQLTTQVDVFKSYDPVLLLSFFEQYLANSSKEERARMDPVLFSKMSDFAALHEIHDIISLSRPMITKVEATKLMSTRTGKAWRYMLKNIADEKCELVDNETLYNSLVAFSKTPLPSGTRNQIWLDASDKIRRAQSLFWRLLREEHRTGLEEHKIGAADIAEDIKHLSADEGTDHLEMLEEERSSILTKMAQPKISVQPLAPHQPQTQWGSEPSTSKSVPDKKEKDKTRPVDQPLEAAVANLVIQPPPPAPKAIPTFALPKQALATFKLIFPEHYAAYKPMQWQTFVQAMAAIGFVASNAAGSHVNFVRRANEASPLAGKFQVGKPHPETNIHIGRMSAIRLKLRKFGLCSESFVPEEKVEN